MIAEDDKNRQNEKSEDRKNYTIEDIARELGLNKSTVSRAISGKGRIGKETRERVLAFVQQQNYTPNVMAKGLANGKSYNLGLILPVEYNDSDILFFRDCIQGISEVAAAYNYDVLLISDSQHQGLVRIQRVIDKHKVDGFIIARSVIDSYVQHILEENEIPFVIIGPSEQSDIHFVDNQNREASRELTEILLMKGIHRLALFGGNRMHRVSESRLQGFLDAHMKQGIEANPALYFSNISNYLQIAKSVKQVLETGADGILCMDEFITNLTLRCLRENGIVVPGQMKLASFYDSPQLEYNVPTVTGIRFNTIALGEKAGSKLLIQLGENVTENTSLMNYQVILRESTYN